MDQTPKPWMEVIGSNYEKISLNYWMFIDFKDIIPDDAVAWKCRFFDQHNNHFDGYFIEWTNLKHPQPLTIYFVVFGMDSRDCHIEVVL